MTAPAHTAAMLPAANPFQAAVFFASGFGDWAGGIARIQVLKESQRAVELRMAGPVASPPCGPAPHSPCRPRPLRAFPG